MNSRKLTVLTIIAGVLALGEFGSAVMIWLEHTGPAAGALLAALFGLFLFLLGAWLLPSGRVTAGTIFVGLLCLVEVAAAPPRWGRRGAHGGRCPWRAKPRVTHPRQAAGRRPHPGRPASQGPLTTTALKSAPRTLPPTPGDSHGPPPGNSRDKPAAPA
jgi:hypothetical protein